MTCRQAIPGALALLAAVVLALAAHAASDQLAQPAPAAATTPAASFEAIDVFVDAGTASLAAWQVELRATHGSPTIVGVEGGIAGVYRDPPYYDPAALAGSRIILASYTTAEKPPQGSVHVARLHLRVEGEHDLSVRVMAAADPQEKAIKATARIAPVRREPGNKE